MVELYFRVYAITMLPNIPSIPENKYDWLETWGWDERMDLPLSAYVHVPFCRHRCGYCNFSLLANRDDLFDRFLQAIEIELSKLNAPRMVETIFLGGGTPSMLPQVSMKRLLNALRHWLPIEATGEWTIEANPLDITEAFCEQIRLQGINRISIGGQSFQASKLQQLERDHRPDQLLEAVERSIKYFESVSLDLIFAAPGESLSLWKQDLQTAIGLGVQHISTYGLTFEKGSKFWGLRERSKLESLSEELELEMYREAIDQLTRAGFGHYEISNFAKHGYHCRHNQRYWRGDAWWAFGPSAARYVGGARSVNHRSTLEYIRRIEQGRSPVQEIEVLSLEQRDRERFIFGMRQMQGIDWVAMRAEVSPDVSASLEAVMEKHVKGGWMVQNGNNIRLTQKGLFVSDALWSEYL
jgi:oxygen-independent coproporphyrinogen-3 oxidase